MRELKYFIKNCEEEGGYKVEIWLTEGNCLLIKLSNMIDISESEQFLYITTEREQPYSQTSQKRHNTHIINKSHIIRMKYVDEVEL